MEITVGTVRFSPQSRNAALESEDGLPEDDRVWPLTNREVNRIPFGTILFGPTGRTFKAGMDILPPAANSVMSGVGVREDQINTDPR